jgi:hypothetical protein
VECTIYGQFRKFNVEYLFCSFFGYLYCVFVRKFKSVHFGRRVYIECSCESEGGRRAALVVNIIFWTSHLLSLHSSHCCCDLLARIAP